MGAPAVPHLSVKAAIVRPVSRTFATAIIHRYEWLGTMAHSDVHFGIFFGQFCAGVTCVCTNGGGTAGAHAHKQFGIERRELATLVRGACVHWAPPNSNSKLVTWTCKLLAGRGQRLIWAFSDTDAGEIGTIYQACGWTCVGRTAPHEEWVSPGGRVMNRALPSQIVKRHGLTWDDATKALVDAGWKVQKDNRKLRYCKVLDAKDKRLVDKIESMRVPYPKRPNAGKATQDALPNQGEKARCRSEVPAPDEKE